MRLIDAYEQIADAIHSLKEGDTTVSKTFKELKNITDTINTSVPTNYRWLLAAYNKQYVQKFLIAVESGQIKKI